MHLFIGDRTTSKKWQVAARCTRALLLAREHVLAQSGECLQEQQHASTSAARVNLRSARQYAQRASHLVVGILGGDGRVRIVCAWTERRATKTSGTAAAGTATAGTATKTAGTATEGAGTATESGTATASATESATTTAKSAAAGVGRRLLVAAKNVRIEAK